MCRISAELYLIREMRNVPLYVIYTYLSRKILVLMMLLVLAGVSLYSKGGTQTDIGGSLGTLVTSAIGVTCYVAVVIALARALREKSPLPTIAAAYIVLVSCLFYCLRLIMSCINSAVLYRKSPNSITVQNFLFEPVFCFVSFNVLATLGILLMRLFERLGLPAVVDVEAGLEQPHGSIQHATAVVVQPDADLYPHAEAVAVPIHDNYVAECEVSNAGRQHTYAAATTVER